MSAVVSPHVPGSGSSTPTGRSGSTRRGRRSARTGWRWHAPSRTTSRRRSTRSPWSRSRPAMTARPWGASSRTSASTSCSCSRRWPSPRPGRWPRSSTCPRSPVVVWALHETGLRRWRLRPRVDHDPGRDRRGTDAVQPAVAGRPAVRDDPRAPFGSGRRRPGPRRPPAGRGRARDRAAAGWAGSVARSTGMPMSTSTTQRSGQSTGIELVAIDPDEVVERLSSRWPTPTSRALEADARRDWTFEGDPSGAIRSSDRSGRRWRSRRSSTRMASTAARSTATSTQFRFGEPIGIAPCWALGRLTTAGRPFTCTGDIVTAVAMLTTKRLGGAAVYHEIEAIDYATGEVVIANSGEHDLAWSAPGARPRLRPERLVLRQGPALRRLRRPGTGARSRDPRRVHAASGCPWRLPVRRRPGRADRAHVPGDGHGERRVPLP